MATSLNNLVRLADSFVNADLTTFEGFRKHLIAWYVFKFKVTFKDPTLLDHTLEELALLYLMHEVKDNPQNYEKILGNPEAEDFEDWLKKTMGDDYQTEEEMAEEMLNSQKRIEEIAKTLPDRITTDFSQFGEVDE